MRSSHRTESHGILKPDSLTCDFKKSFSDMNGPLCGKKAIFFYRWEGQYRYFMAGEFITVAACNLHVPNGVDGIIQITPEEYVVARIMES